ncbi:MAG: transcriptional repressor [Planctomycetota bacterium]
MSAEKSDRAWAKETIQAAGLRATGARVATLSVLRIATGPLSHSEVCDHLAEHEIDRATVFRNLSDMVRANLIRRSELGDHVWRFEIVADSDSRHPHFVCIDCGSITCIEEIELSRESQSASRRLGEVTEILLRGHCVECV